MYLDCAVNAGHTPLHEVFASAGFKDRFLRRVVAGAFGVERPWDRPAEYIVNKPTAIIAEADECLSVTVRLSGVTRNGRSMKTHHTAIEALTELVVDTAKVGSSGNPAQVAIIYELIEGDIEYPAGSGNYHRVVEVAPAWTSDNDRIVITQEDLDRKYALPR